MKIQHLFIATAFGLSASLAAKSVFPKSRFTVDTESLTPEEATFFKLDSDPNKEPMFNVQNDNNRPESGSGGTFHDNSLDLQSPDGERPQTGPTLLRSALVLNTGISVFASYLRDDEQLSYRLNDDKGYTLVLAPSNNAMAQLSAKPWEFPIVIVDSMSEREKELTAGKNIATFVEGHLSLENIHASEILNDENQVKEIGLMSGKAVQAWASEGEIYFRRDGREIMVEKVYKASNGEIWILPESLVEVKSED